MILFRLAALAALNKNYMTLLQKKRIFKTIQLLCPSEKKITHENKLSRLRFKIL